MLKFWHVTFFPDLCCAHTNQVDMDRGTWLTMPYGWKVGQIQAEQPTTMYGDYTSKVLNEIARPPNMPFNIASGNSASYNYASGRLDHQSFFKAIRIDQAHIADIVLDQVFRGWLSEAVLIEGLLPQSIRTLLTTVAAVLKLLAGAIVLLVSPIKRGHRQTLPLRRPPPATLRCRTSWRNGWEVCILML